MKSVRFCALVVFLFAALNVMSARDARKLVTTSNTTDLVQAAGTVGVNVDRQFAQELLKRRDQNLTIELPLPGYGTVPVELERSTAITPATRIHTTGRNGQHSIIPSSSFVAYMGSVPSMPSSIVALVIDPDGIYATVDDGQVNWTLGKQTTTDVKASTNYTVRKLAITPSPCGTDEGRIPPSVREYMNGKIASEDVQADNGDTLTLQISIDADYLYYSKKTSVNAATSYITRIMTFTDNIYRRDMKVKVEVTDLHIWTDEEDPYTDGTNVFELIPEFRTKYNEAFPSVQRDIALLITQRTEVGGIAASIGGICNGDNSYCVAGVGGDLTNDPETQESFDATMIPHEIGHVCGGVHTQNCLWQGGPLDSCVVSEMGSCVTSDMVAPAKGTIMSYCHMTRQQGGSIQPAFHVRHKAVIREFLSHAVCVGNNTSTRNCELTGFVTDALSGNPIKNVQLRIRTLESYDALFLGTPPIGADSTATTDEHGSYAFKNIPYGWYAVVLPDGYAEYPMRSIDIVPGVKTILASEHQEMNFSIVPVTNLPVKIGKIADSTSVVLVAVSESFATLSVMNQFEVRGGSDTIINLKVPQGHYTIVPLASKHDFVPMQLSVDVTNDKVLTPLNFERTVATETGERAVFVGSEMVDNRLKLHAGDSLLHYDQTFSEQKVFVFDEEAVVVAPRIPLFETRFVYLRPDTSLFVAYETDSYFVTSGMEYVYNAVVKKRHEPRYARLYNFKSEQRTYAAITGTELAKPNGGTAFPVKVQLPFDIPFGDSKTNIVWVYGRGVLGIGNSNVPIETNLQSTYYITDLLVSAFDGSSQVVNSASIQWVVTGAEPNRTFTAQWSNISVLNQTGQFQGVNAQVLVEEGSGRITVIYGSMPKSGPATPVTIAIGLRGADGFDYQGIDAAASWTEPNRRTDGYAGPLNAFTSKNIPPSGTTYIWTPPNATSVDEDDLARGLSVYPNPTNGDVLHIGSTASPKAVTVLDISGRVVDRQLGRSNIDIRALSTGLYIAQIEMENGTVHTIPFTRVR